MSDPVPSAQEDVKRAPRSLGSRLLGGLGAVFALALVLVLLMHVFSPPISRDTARPSGHPGSACIVCHVVTAPSDTEVRP